MKYLTVEDFIRILNEIDLDKMIYCYVPSLSLENLSPVCGIEEHEDVVELKYAELERKDTLINAPSMTSKSIIEVLKEVEQDKCITYKVKDKLLRLDPLIGINEYADLIELQFDISI